MWSLALGGLSGRSWLEGIQGEGVACLGSESIRGAELGASAQEDPESGAPPLPHTYL